MENAGAKALIQSALSLDAAGDVTSACAFWLSPTDGALGFALCVAEADRIDMAAMLRKHADWLENSVASAA